MKNSTLCCCLCLAHFVWLTFFIAEAILTNFNVHTICFYILTFGVLLYRFYSVCWCTVLFHILIPFVVLIVLIAFTCCVYILKFPNLVILISLALQIIAAIPLMVMRWKRSCDEQALKTGIHAHLGLITIIIYFWTLTFVIRRPFEACALTMIYMLCFLAVLLTPALYGVVKNVYRERSKDIKSSMSLSAFREQIQSRPITVESRSGPLRTIQSRASEASRQSMSLDLEIFVRRK